MNSLERFRAACLGAEVDRPPVWIMRQAGRALPEYRVLRQRYSFWEILTTPKLACEASLQPVRRFPLDAVILFSDILVIPAAMGIKVEFDPAPALTPTVKGGDDLRFLTKPNVRKALAYVADTIRLIKDEVGGTHAILGFSAAPFTLACYMIDGTGSNRFVRTRTLMYSRPQFFHELLDRVSKVVTEYLRIQANAGVTAFQLFDTWAGELALREFEEFSLKYVSEILKSLEDTGVPSIYYINGISHLLEAAASSGCQVLALDWRIPLSDARHRLGDRVALQGNLDPAILFSAPEVIECKVHRMLDLTGGRGHIVNLGHGLMPETPLGGMGAFVRAVQSWQRK